MKNKFCSFCGTQLIRKTSKAKDEGFIFVCNNCNSKFVIVHSLLHIHDDGRFFVGDDFDEG